MTSQLRMIAGGTGALAAQRRGAEVASAWEPSGLGAGVLDPSMDPRGPGTAPWRRATGLEGWGTDVLAYEDDDDDDDDDLDDDFDDEGDGEEGEGEEFEDEDDDFLDDEDDEDFDDDDDASDDDDEDDEDL